MGVEKAYRKGEESSSLLQQLVITRIKRIHRQ